MADDPGLTADADRELAARRRDLEQEFDAKLRDLKAQHKRLVDSLEQDRKEWEARRREQQKELADREERLRRREDNKERAAEAKGDDRKELAALRLRVRELEERSLDAKTSLAKLEERVAKTAKASAGTQGLFSALSGVAILGGIAWIVTALQAGDRAAVAVAALFVAVATVLWLIQRRLRLGRVGRS